MSPARLVMPSVLPAFGDVRLRAFGGRDVDMLLDLSTDPYVPKTGTLPGHASRREALAYIGRQHEPPAPGGGLLVLRRGPGHRRGRRRGRPVAGVHRRGPRLGRICDRAA